MHENTDTIKSRMLRRIAKTWDYPGVENEAAFDPLVALLINACAAELAKINRDKRLSQSHLIEEVASLLIPEAATRAAPAHAIVSSSPLKSVGYVDEKEQFRCIEQSSGTSREVYFSPTSRFPLVNMEVKFQASGNSICRIIDHRYKKVLSYADQDKILPAGTFYVGLDAGDEIESVDEVSFFFNILNRERTDFFFELLKNSRWYLDDRELEKNASYPSTVQYRENLEDLTRKRYRTNDMRCRDIHAFYQRQFITVKNITNLSVVRGNLPEVIQNAFSQDTLSGIDTNLVWLKIEWPVVPDSKIIDGVFCFTNCFPVLNRKVQDLMFRLQENLNIIPLKNSDFFYDIKKIVDSEEESYHIHEPGEANVPEENSVLLRTRGVGRFGAFEAKEELQYLLETLKDETASYAAMGTEAIERIVSEINVLMGELEEKVDSTAVDQTISYLIMHNQKDHGSLFVEYWSTAGDRANNIDAGYMPEVKGRSDIQPESTVFITPAMGGRNRLSDEEQLAAFKSTLLAGNRLVTAEDIKSFCIQHLGRRLQRVDVVKGVANGTASKEGLVRTIDIRLTPDTRVPTSAKEWDSLLGELLAKIRMRAARSFPYRLILNDHNDQKTFGLN